MFELADTGTLFLDEIGELPINLQSALLRVLQDHEVTRVGGQKSKKVDVRIVAATNRNLEEMIEEGTFRSDLYYRLNVVSVNIPPLRESQANTISRGRKQFFNFHRNPTANLCSGQGNYGTRSDQTRYETRRIHIQSCDSPGHEPANFFPQI